MKKFLIICLFCLWKPLSADPLTEEMIIKRINAHLVLKDYEEGHLEALNGLKAYPNSSQIYKAYINVLAEKGAEKEMLKAWKAYQEFPNGDSRQMIEQMAWGVIKKGVSSPSPMVRIMSLLAGFLSQDARGVSMLFKHLSDPNALIRKVAVELSSQLKDEILCKKMVFLLNNEKNWMVYAEAIKAAGEMKIKAADPILTRILTDEKTSLQEKTAALIALVNMTDSVSHQQLQDLIKSPRMGLRLLACELIYHQMLEAEVPLLLTLAKDPQAQVRMAALQILGLFGRIPEFKEKTLQIALSAIEDRNPEVHISAAWLLTLMDHPEGEAAFKRLLKHPEPKLRVLACAALASTGKHGISLLRFALNHAEDPYVRMNASLGLIAQHEEIQNACEELYLGLKERSERWMWEELGIFKALAPSTHLHDESIPRYPESIDQATRLEILNTLAVMNSPHAQEAIKHFLKEKTWGISGMASVLLLSEGDETALKIVENLIDDPDPQISIQSALVLAMWGKGEKAISILQNAYSGSSRDLKEKILEGLGRIGAETSIPFLIEQLEEPFQTLRIIAASALLMCLYH